MSVDALTARRRGGPWVTLWTWVGTIVAIGILTHATALVAVPAPTGTRRRRRRGDELFQAGEPREGRGAGLVGGFDAAKPPADLRPRPPEIVEHLDSFRHRTGDDARVIADRFREHLKGVSKGMIATSSVWRIDRAVDAVCSCAGGGRFPGRF